MSDALRPHSERYFTDARDHWWHADYLSLLARRLELPAAPAILEVGAGQGHFGRAWAPHLPSGFSFVGLDREARSLAVARARTEAFREELGLAGRFEFVEGSAEELPFADECFDLVLCQTLLIHVPEPLAVFAEMVRVCRRGGAVLAAEPSNLSNLQRMAFVPSDEPDPFVEARFSWRCSKGKARLGLGDNDFGLQLPTLFEGLADVRYAMSDRPLVLAPPYARPEEQAYVADLEASVREGVFGWERDEARRYYLAGGGEVEAFERDYDALLAQQEKELAAVRAHERVELCGSALLIAWGRKR